MNYFHYWIKFFNKWNEKLYYIGQMSNELNDFINNYSNNKII